jgi:hypothetical protein
MRRTLFKTMKESQMKSKLIALLTTSLLSATTFAAEPDTQVIEYYHPLLKHYFITASAADARFVDAGNAGAGWERTGVTFAAWSSRDLAPPNASMVYRYYSHGANSHVYVASDADVSLLNRLEAKERAEIAGTKKSFLGWGLEGEAFLTVLPQAGQCPAGTQPITRNYNRNFAGSDGSNHRYTTDDSLTRSMEDRKWEPEGAVFCSPLSAASASASTSNSFALASSYSGNVQFKFEEVGKPEVKSRATLTLAFAADGTVSGSGAGCKFAGSVAAMSATSNRFRGGSVTATGCTDARFNGVYGRVEIEQFGPKAIDIRFRQGDNAREVTVEGVLNAAVATTPPSVTPSPSNSGAVAGDFSGVLSVMITQRLSGQAETIVLNVNQSVTLKVGNTGAISGTVQGCAISGSIAPGVDNRFTGSILVSGCAESRLNGNYVVGVHLEDGGAIEVELEREVEQAGVRIKVTIEGNLSRTSGGTTPTPTPPTPPASGIAIAGSYAGAASFEATRRPAGGREVVEVSNVQALSLTVSSTGSVSGTGAGCSFSGSLASNPLGGFIGTVTATACTAAIVRGSYIATVTREDGGALEVELERETETNGERVKVKIKGRLSKQ